MKYIVLITYITIALVQLGILINSVTLAKIFPKEMALKYWACSLMLSSIGIICIAAGSAVLTSLKQGSFFLALSNTMYFTSLVMLVFYSKSLKDKITDKDIKIFTLLTIFYGIGFEIIRQKGNFIDRQIFSASLLFIIYFLLRGKNYVGEYTQII